VKRGHLAFIGVSTGSSSILPVFPLWAERLGLEGATIVGHDLPLGATRAAYRATVRGLRDDDTCAGALITTHKVALFEAARDLFADVGASADLCGECSCLSKREGAGLVATAKDPLAAAQAIGRFLPDGHFESTDGHVLCLGAGGAATAIAVHLLTSGTPARRPRRLILVDRDPARLEANRAIHRRLHTGGDVDYVLGDDARVNDRLVGELPPGSLVVNATGMGKDSPGSPLTDGVSFPSRGLVWELNYRGELRFLHQARERERARSLTVVDGWDYFVFGWSAVIEEVYGLTLGDADIGDMAEIARRARRDSSAT